MHNKICKYFYTVLACVLLLIGYLIWSSLPPQNLEVYVLDVGQGDSLLIRTPAGQNVLIDGGRDNTVLYQLGKRLPYTQRSIDLIVLTHPDSDHVTGLLEILRRYEVSHVLYQPVIDHNQEAALFSDFVTQEHATTINPLTTGVIELAGGVVLEIWWPHAIDEKRSSNDGSIVLHLTYKKTDMLFTGDISEDVEQLLVERGIASVDVVQLPHHGSGSSGSSVFLDALRPTLGVISAGLENSYGHPAAQTLQRLEHRAIPWLLTAGNGTIWLKSDGMQWQAQYLEK